MIATKVYLLAGSDWCDDMFFGAIGVRGRQVVSLSMVSAKNLMDYLFVALTPFPSWIPPFFKKHVVNSASRQEREGFVELEIGCCALEMEQYRFQVESSRDGAANLHCSLKTEQIQHSMMATNTFVSSPVKSMMHQSPEPIRNRVGESAAFILSRRTYRNVNENAFGKRSWCTTKTINCGRQINDGT